MTKKITVVFATERLEKQFENLDKKEVELKKHLFRAIEDLKGNPFSGKKLARHLWPKEYIQKYGIDNLWKYDLPKSWRLIYTIINEGEVELVSVILEWFNHKDYERRFRYLF